MTKNAPQNYNWTDNPPPAAKLWEMHMVKTHTFTVLGRPMTIPPEDGFGNLTCPDCKYFSSLAQDQILGVEHGR